MKPSCSSPLPRGESFGSGREGFSSCAQAAGGPRLASRVPQRRRALSLSGQGIREEKDSKSVRRGVEGTKTSLRGCAHQPPYPKSRATGARIRLPEPPRNPGRRPLVAESEHYERFSDRIGTLLRSKQAGLAWSREKEREEGTRADQRGTGGGRGQPEGIKGGQEGAKTLPATIELLPPLSWV